MIVITTPTGSGTISASRITGAPARPAAGYHPSAASGAGGVLLEGLRVTPAVCSWDDRSFDPWALQRPRQEL